MNKSFHKDIRKRTDERQRFAILRAAMAVFSEQGYDKASLADIAIRADINQDCLCEYFKTKKDLFQSVIKWGEHQLLHQIREAKKRCRNTHDLIDRTLKTYFRFFEKREPFFRVLVEEKYQFHDEIKSHLQRISDLHLNELESDIRNGINEGIIREIEPHYCALMINSMANGLFYDWMHSDTKKRIIELFNISSDFISHAMYCTETETRQNKVD